MILDIIATLVLKFEKNSVNVYQGIVGMSLLAFEVSVTQPGAVQSRTYSVLRHKSPSSRRASVSVTYLPDLRVFILLLAHRLQYHFC